AFDIPAEHTHGRVRAPDLGFASLAPRPLVGVVRAIGDYRRGNRSDDRANCDDGTGMDADRRAGDAVGFVLLLPRARSFCLVALRIAASQGTSQPRTSLQAILGTCLKLLSRMC